MRSLPLLLLLAGFLSPTPGCNPASGHQGSEQQATAYLESELKKWLVGQESEAKAFMGTRISTPFAYDIRAILPDKPDILARPSGSKLPEDWRSWPAFRFNVALELKSQAGTSLEEQIVTYTLTWNPKEEKWYVQQHY